MILLGLGSSVPFCGATLQEVVRFAIRAIDAVAPVERVSRLYHSPAWPDASDPPFVNAVVAVRFGAGPGALLSALHRIESAFGRVRGSRNEPRTLDVDLLAFGRLIQSGTGRAEPILPHPRMATRDFVLAPLCDIAPGWTCPMSGKTAKEMLARLQTVSARPLAA